MNPEPPPDSQSLSDSEERLRLALEAADICIWDWNLSRNIVTFSDNFSRLFKTGDSPFDGRYESFLALIHPQDRARVDGALQAAIRQNRHYDEEFRIIWPPDEIHWMRIRGNVYTNERNTPLRLMGSIHDKTERRNAQDALINAHILLEQRVRERTTELSLINERLRSEIAERKKLQNEIMEIGEKERQRIGHDLHDHILQQIGGIIFLSQALQSRLEQGNHPGAADMHKIISHLNMALKQIRNLSRGLYPIIEKSGLKQAIADYAHSLHEVFGVTVHLKYDGRITFADSTVAIHLFRIVQEALHNAIRHGGARNLYVSLRRLRGETRLEIRDDGSGFPQKPNRKGMGLNIMKYRASVIGADFQLSSHKSQGTTIVCSLRQRKIAAARPPDGGEPKHGQ